MSSITAGEHQGIPHFQYEILSRPYVNGMTTIVLIKAGSKVIHCDVEICNFYNVLGYSDEIRHAGICFDEFIWLEYGKNRCKSVWAGLQAKLVEYLIMYSSVFMQQYSAELDGWLGYCEEVTLENGVCTYCIMRSTRHQVKPSRSFIGTSHG